MAPPADRRVRPEPGQNRVVSDFFPDGFFERADEQPDPFFYGPSRLVTHIDQRAIAAVGSLYDELGIGGQVLDVMSSWVSHFSKPPERLTVLGMNESELAANPEASERTVHDLNRDPSLPYADATFDDVVCCVSVDYLTQPIAVFAEVGRVLRPGGRFVATFSNRLFPTKAVRGWLASDDTARMQIVGHYFELSGAFETPTLDVRIAPGGGGDPLYAVWAVRQGG